MPFTFNSAFSRFFTLMGQNFALFAALGLLGSVLPAVVINYFLFSSLGLTSGSWANNYNLLTTTTWPFVTGAALILWFLNLVCLAFITEVAIVRSVNKPLNVSAVLGHALANAFPIFIVSLIVSILTVLCMLLFIVPGIMFAIASLVAVPARIGQPNLGIWGSVQRSFELTKGHRWTLFALLFVGGLVVSVLSGGVTYSTVFLGTVGTIGPVMVNTVVQAITGLISTVFVAAIYVTLRESQDRLAPDQAANVFE